MSSCTAAVDLFTLITTLFASQCIPDTSTFLPTNFAPNLKNNAEFDFIIVGGGSAGCVLANRLSENADWRVLLLEAGSYPSKLSEIPYLFPAMYLTPETWMYKSAPLSTACLGFQKNQCISAYGKMLGGSSNLDFLINHPGIPNDYDNWSKLGNSGWDWKNVSEYYKKSKEIHTPENVEIPSFYIPIREAYKELDYPYNVKNNYNQLLDVPLNVKGGRRNSYAKAYLSPIRTRSNLYVALNSHVTKLNVTQDGTITGVLVKINGLKEINLIATKEVIVSCGAANSAKLLMLSGIGPKEELQKHNIDQIKDLPVGSNLQDHFVTMGVLIRVNDSPHFRKEGFGSEEDIKQYFNNSTGPLAASNMNTLAFLSTRNESLPNFYILYQSYSKNDLLMPLLLTGLHVNEVTSKSITKYNQENHLIFAGIALVEPKSRGTVKLQSANPLQDPIIDYKYLSDDEDLKEFLKAIDAFKNVLNTEAMSNLNATLVDFDIPNCKHLEFDTSEYWGCNLRNFATSLYLPSGTCKMGPSTDRTSVVGPSLNVHGTNKLRVVDASITPHVPRVTSNLPEVIIAEKAADLIKMTYEHL